MIEIDVKEFDRLKGSYPVITDRYGQTYVLVNEFMFMVRQTKENVENGDEIVK